jgi:hypothetical protein
MNSQLIELFDDSLLQAVMIRWKLAEQYLSERSNGAETGKMALHVLVAHDVPILLEEVNRLRADAAFS